MRDLFISGVFFSFFVYGFRAPFILILGYVWVDIFTPQLLSYGFLRNLPVSQIIGIAAILALLLVPPVGKVKQSFVTVTMFVFGCWMTLTLLWAVLPDQSFDKWNWAIKSIWVACLVPLFIRGRTELEALIWVIVLAGIAHCIPFGAKVLISGGGYGQAKGLISTNNGYGEGSTLAMFSVSLIPLCLFLMKHSEIIPITRIMKMFLWGCIAAALLTSLGTFARTGLVCSGVLGLALFFRSKRKILYAIVAISVGITLALVMGSGWKDRMETITDTTESSSMGRVAVWVWTMDYVATHPFGGGFRVHEASEYDYSLTNGEVLHIHGKAPHNNFFEVLGEGGYPGIILYAMILINTIMQFNRIRKIPVAEKDRWLTDLGDNLLITVYVYMVGGMFVGVAFQSYLYYLAAISTIMQNIASRLDSATK